MRNIAELWDSYSNVYDILNKFYPYKKHLEYICSLLNPEKGKLYLDAGCGTGNLTIKIYASNGVVIGIDYSNKMINKAKNKNKLIKFDIADLNEKLNFPDNYFDGVISNNVIAYLKNPLSALLEINRILKPGGKFVVSTLGKGWNPMVIYGEHLKYEGLLNTIQMIIPLIGLSFYNKRILNLITSKKYSTYDANDFSLLLEKTGFYNIETSFSYANQNIVAVCRKQSKL